MKVKLRTSKHIEVNGVFKTCRPGMIVDIGKQTAFAWVANGDAEHARELSSPSAGWVQRPSRLLKSVRAFWFNNEPGPFCMDEIAVSRKEIFEIGGPNPEFNDCPICQKSEWLSRLRGDNHFVDHFCLTSMLCEDYCLKQGREDFLHMRQNFWFAHGIDKSLDAPKCLMVQSPKGYRHVWSHSCDQGQLIFLRQFAYACQYDVLHAGQSPKRPLSDYDFAFTICSGEEYEPFPRGLPLILYGHDLWKQAEARQGMINDLKPQIFWTPFYSSWIKKFSFGPHTEIVFRPIPASNFFTRPNLSVDKSVDLLAIGADSSPIYQPRRDLRDQLLRLDGFNVVLHNYAGAKRSLHSGSSDTALPFLANWSRFLGSAKFVIFEGIADDPQPVFFKFYEALGSGAIPIFPQATDLARLGIFPDEHYIPVERFRGNNAALAETLNNYDNLRHIAQNATSWYRNNTDALLFNDFEGMIRGMTKYKYPRRLI